MHYALIDSAELRRPRPSPALPRGLLPDGAILSEEPPRVLLMEARADGVVLLRFTAAGAFAGESAHHSAAAAREQARREFADALGPWGEIPEGADDPVMWALQRG